MFLSEIKTIKKGGEFKYKEKGSVFTARSFGIENPDNSAKILKEITKESYDASHHCYAWRLADGTYKTHDDGEPSGTAGLRIINAIDHFRLTNVLLIVTRHFGGTKLGVGPLGKAYYYTAEGSLSASEIITLSAFNKIFIDVHFDHVSSIHKLLNETGSRIIDINYGNSVKFECFVKPEAAEILKERVIEITRGNAQLTLSEDYYLI